MSLCQYKDIFGEVGEGVHAYRLFDIAVVDAAAVLIAAYIISQSSMSEKKYWKTAGILFLVGILAHRLFCVRTTVDKFLFD